jgi:hypothetical protein
MLETLYAIGGPAWRLVDANTLGAVQVIDDPIPPGGTYIINMWGVEDRNGVPHRWFSFRPWDAEAARTRLLGLHEAAHQRALDRGFPVLLEGQPETLQLRTEDDKINWLTFKDACHDMIDMGLGNYPNPLPLRTTSNNQYSVTANQGVALMQGLRTWAAAVMRRGWQIKDTIVQARTPEEFGAAEAAIGTGYP